MKAASRKAFFNSVFTNLSSTLLVNPRGYLVRIHEDSKVRFAHVERDHAKRLERLLELQKTNCHSIVGENEPVDLFMDIEMSSSTWCAAQAVLKEVVEAVQVLLNLKFGTKCDLIEHVLVLNASGKNRQKQSLHVHVRLDKPLASRKDVKVFVLQLKAHLPAAVSTWVDVQPCVSGSMRLMQATTKSGDRPLLPLDMTDLADKKLRSYLESKAPVGKELMMEMALMKRFDVGESYVFSPPEKTEEENAERSKEWKQFTKNADIKSLIDSGEVKSLLDALPYDCADTYEDWSRVMWAVKSLATHDPACEEELYAAFDEFSQLSASKYRPDTNRRTWNSMKGTFPKTGLYTLRKMVSDKA